MAVIAAQAWRGQPCPLTVWALDSRCLAGQAACGGSFIEHGQSRLLYGGLP